MGCHLGWYSTVRCPLRGERGEQIKKKGGSGPPKTIKEKKVAKELKRRLNF
jgi:hypothetical protein